MAMLTSGQKWIARETVAEAMLELLTREDYVGGTILEVSGCGTRVVKMIGVSIIPIRVVFWGLEGKWREGVREAVMYVFMRRLILICVDAG